MHYVSTRGDAPRLNFSQAMLAGLARDGGLYVPETYPQLARETIAGFAGKPYREVAEAVIRPFAEGDAGTDLRGAIAGAYSVFRHAAIAPLVQVDDNLFVQELFHGPTLAFKDVAMQLLGRLMNDALARSNQRATIVGATSGDTGAAAIEAFRGLDRVDVFILYPHGRVSDVQRRQMTTVDAGNVHAIALEGTFDDCQAIVKGMFNHHAFRDSMKLSGVNSINWARIVAQIVYYFTGAAALGGPLRPVSFAVPTGNFGDILAGYVAKRMGLPVNQFSIATNANDILARTMASGAYEIRGVTPTQSPSMDIQISSNFERLLFDVHGRDASEVRSMMNRLAQAKRFDIAEQPLAAIRSEFTAHACDEPSTSSEMKRTYAETGYLIDPHTATGTAAARRMLAQDPATPVIALATAHPAKFPDAVKAATGKTAPLPDHLADLMERRERFTVLANDQGAVERYVRERARISAGVEA